MAGLTCAELTFIDGMVFGFIGLFLALLALKAAYEMGKEAGQ